eukprot:10126056-Ditylum_brightwellii.AAC.1
MLNLLRPCKQNPALSAQVAIHGCYIFEATPMVSPGTKCFIHIKPHKCASWGFHAEDAWYVGPALNHYRCCMVVMKQSTVQQMTNTIKFRHHNVQLPTITPVEQIEKAIKELTNAINANSTEGPANYIEAVQRLRVVVLGEKQQPHVLAPMKEVPQRNPSQTAEQSGTTKAVPTNALPNRSLALIPCYEDEVEPIQQEPEPYNFRDRAVHIINTVIFEESPNITSAARPPKHINKYTKALKHLVLTEAFECEMYTQTGMFVSTITDPETGKQLEYCDLVSDARYKAVWEKAFTKELNQLAQ